MAKLIIIHQTLCVNPLDKLTTMQHSVVKVNIFNFEPLASHMISVIFTNMFISFFIYESNCLKQISSDSSKIFAPKIQEVVFQPLESCASVKKLVRKFNENFIF